MKKLSEVTYEDAIEILRESYGNWFLTGKWILEDRTNEIGEPCKLLYGRHKLHEFWFFDDGIDLDLMDDDKNPYLDIVLSSDVDVLVATYVKAHNMGYHIQQFDKLKL